MANVTLQGKIKQIHETVSRVHNEKEFKTRVLWLEEIKDSYPSTWSLETSGDKTLLLDSHKVGDIVDCKVDIVGRAYTGKDGKEGVFNSLKCFGIYKVEGQQQASAPSQKQEPQPPKDNPNMPPRQVVAEPTDDLPF